MSSTTEGQCSKASAALLSSTGLKEQGLSTTTATRKRGSATEGKDQKDMRREGGRMDRETDGGGRNLPHGTPFGAPDGASRGIPNANPLGALTKPQTLSLTGELSENQTSTRKRGNKKSTRCCPRLSVLALFRLPPSTRVCLLEHSVSPSLSVLRFPSFLYLRSSRALRHHSLPLEL